MIKPTLVVTPEQEQYRQRFTEELARDIGCNPDSLPTTTTKAIACQYLGIVNHKTLDVWRCTGRHGIVMVRVGKHSRPATDWLINMKLSSVSIAGAAA